VTEALGFVFQRFGKDVDRLDLATGANKRHAAPRFADFEAAMGVAFGLLATTRVFGEAVYGKRVTRTWDRAGGLKVGIVDVEFLWRLQLRKRHDAGLLVAGIFDRDVLQRLGLSRMRDLEPAPPVHRYERQEPGEMIHLDTKKLGRFERVGHRITGDRTGQSNSRGVGWEYVHVCIDDASRIAFCRVMPDEKKESAVAFRCPSPGPLSGRDKACVRRSGRG